MKRQKGKGSEKAVAWIKCTGDACVGDVVRFTEKVWGGSHWRPVAMGSRTIVARIVKDSYGAAKQQHTFTLEVISCEGAHPVSLDKKLLRKGRNLYRNGTERQRWHDERQRKAALAEKHSRGNEARRARSIRRDEEDGFY